MTSRMRRDDRSPLRGDWQGFTVMAKRVCIIAPIYNKVSEGQPENWDVLVLILISKKTPPSSPPIRQIYHAIRCHASVLNTGLMYSIYAALIALQISINAVGHLVVMTLPQLSLVRPRSPCSSPLP
jgi:hypothetical protein